MRVLTVNKVLVLKRNGAMQQLQRYVFSQNISHEAVIKFDRLKFCFAQLLLFVIWKVAIYSYPSYKVVDISSSEHHIFSSGELVRRRRLPFQLFLLVQEPQTPSWEHLYGNSNSTSVAKPSVAMAKFFKIGPTLYHPIIADSILTSNPAGSHPIPTISPPDHQHINLRPGPQPRANFANISHKYFFSFIKHS